MSVSSLQDRRRGYRNLLDTELAKGTHLLQKDRTQGEVEAYLKDVITCINKLDALQEKLENVGERLSLVVEGQEGEAGILDLIQEDWEYISTVMDCRDELVNLRISLQEQVSSKESFPSMIETDNSLDKMMQLKAQLQQVLLGQQELQQQLIAKAQLNKGEVAARGFEMRNTNTEAAVQYSVTDLTSTYLGGELSLGGGPRLKSDLSSQHGQILESNHNLEISHKRDLSLGRGPNFGEDQGLGGGPRLGNDQCSVKGPTLKRDLSLGADLRIGTDQSSGRGQRLGRDHIENWSNRIKACKSKRQSARKGFNYCSGHNAWLKSKPKKKHVSSKKSEFMWRQKAVQKCRSKRKYTSRLRSMSARLRRHLSLGRGVREVIQLGRGPMFRRDLDIRVLSLGRGPILVNCPGKSRLSDGNNIKRNSFLKL